MSILRLHTEELSHVSPPPPSYALAFCWGNPAATILIGQALRPTTMPVVPRVLNRFHDKIVQGALAAGGLKAKLFVKACEAKVRRAAG